MQEPSCNPFSFYTEILTPSPMHHLYITCSKNKFSLTYISPNKTWIMSNFEVKETVAWETFSLKESRHYKTILINH
jgi:hypothetical protein